MASRMFTCRDRASAPPGPYRDTKNADTWDERPNGDKTCSYCGSMSFDDFLRCAKLAADPRDMTWIEKATGKNYKWYAHQPGVSNASEGGIKFYTWHVPDKDAVDQINAVLADAVPLSHEKAMRQIDAVMASLERKN
jgi:hypothetical protein